VDPTRTPSPPENTGDASTEQTPRTLGDSAIEGVRWMGIARVVAGGAAFLGSLVLARFISPAQFGYAAAALGLAMIAPNFLMQMYGTPLVQSPTLRREHVESALLISLVTGALFVLLTPVITNVVVEPLLGESIASLFLLASPMFALAALAAVPRALIQRELAFRTVAMIDVASLLGGTAVSILLATVADVEGASLVLGLVATYAVTVVLLLVYAPTPIPRWRGRDAATSVVRFGGFVGLSSVLATVTANIDYLVLSARLPAADVGYYWRAFMLGITYPLKVSNVMLSVSLPVYSRAANVDEMRRLRLRVMATHEAVMFPLLVTLMVTAPVLVPWLFGAEWEPSVVPTQILSGAGMIAAVVTGTSAYITALGKPQYLPVVNVVAIVGLGSTAYFAAPLGLVGVSWCVLGYYAFLFFVNHFWLLHRVGGIALREVFSDAIPPLAACVPLAASGIATMKLLEAADVSPIVALGVTIPVGLVTYSGALRLAFPETLRSLLGITRRVLARRTVGAADAA
jgi:O-antigen/teichoic acid export membrane protein